MKRIVGPSVGVWIIRELVVGVGKTYTLAMTKVLASREQCKRSGYLEKVRCKTWRRYEQIFPTFQPKAYRFRRSTEKPKCALKMKPILKAQYRNYTIPT